MSLPYSSFLYLFAANTRKEIANLVKNKCIPEESKNYDDILESWEQATQALRKIESDEKGVPESCQITDLDSDLVDMVYDDLRVQKTFSKYSYEVKMVELDNIIATQREVLIDYVDEFSDKIPKSPTDEELVKFCLIPEQKVPLPKPSKKNSSNYFFTSPSIDLRFLGGYIKKYLTMEDVKYTGVGGVPTHVISLFVGYGVSTMNAFEVNGRVILHNGFHRAYGLRKKGIKKIPLLLKKIGNADLEFPSDVNDFKKDYLLNQPRPVLIKDFFNEDLVRVFKRKKRTKVVNVKWESDEFSLDV